VLDPEATAQITDILADDHARLSAFGEQSALDLPFPAAAKTGTSKGFRDNLAAGYTREVTVAVWVGNFDGSGMRGVSGVTGAGPIFRDLMIAAMRGREARPLVDESAPLERVEVCALSGVLPGPSCEHHRIEAFARSKAPTESCSLHVSLAVDRRNHLLAGPGCPLEQVTEEVFEVYPPMYRSWAVAARRPVPPGPSPLCPGARLALEQAPPRLLSPPDGSTYLIDPGSASRQELTLRAEGPGNTLDLYLDGQRHPLTGPPFLLRWPLRPGEHEAWVTSGNLRSESVNFRVE
jgi:penicillin-binding protein 1C